MTDTILIVDDSSFIVEGLVAILKKGYRPMAVYGGQQCLDILQKEKPSIIILDIMMEPMDGWETLARIKENPATQHIPVLMFSAKKISAEEAEEHRVCIDDFVSKPVTPKKLIESIEKVLARQKANRLSIESWRSAGIGQDRIDEYTSLMTSHDVDMSLLQNMKVQLSLLREDDDKNHTHLEGVIAAIESRIQQERFLEEKLSREMQESVTGDAEVKGRAGPVPAMNESGQESLPVEERAETAAQPEISDLQGIAECEMKPFSTEVFVPEVSVSREVTVLDITPIPEVRLPDSSLPDADVIPETTGSGSFFESRDSRESPSEEPEIKVPAEFPADEPERDPVLSGPSFLTEIPEMNSAIRPLPPEIPMGNSGTRVNISSDEKLHPVVEQKLPVGHVPRPLSPRTLDNKPFASDAPIPWTVGSGTDTSLRRSTDDVGRSYGNKGIVNKGKSVPAKEVASSSGGFISRIISTIIGIFKRQGR